MTYASANKLQPQCPILPYTGSRGSLLVFVHAAHRNRRTFHAACSWRSHYSGRSLEWRRLIGRLPAVNGARHVRTPAPPQRSLQQYTSYLLRASRNFDQRANFALLVVVLVVHPVNRIHCTLCCARQLCEAIIISLPHTRNSVFNHFPFLRNVILGRNIRSRRSSHSLHRPCLPSWKAASLTVLLYTVLQFADAAQFLVVSTYSFHYLFATSQVVRPMS